MVLHTPVPYQLLSEKWSIHYVLLSTSYTAVQIYTFSQVQRGKKWGKVLDFLLSNPETSIFAKHSACNTCLTQYC